MTKVKTEAPSGMGRSKQCEFCGQWYIQPCDAKKQRTCANPKRSAKKEKR